jgi:hypothetical protein
MARVCFIQEAGEASQTFRFEDDRLVVAEADARTAREFALAYLDVDLNTPREEPPRRGLFGAFRNPARHVYARFPLFEPRRGRETIEVWADKQAQEIVAQLSARWREARRRAVTVDFSADPRHEIQRFQTLLGRGIVSAEEGAAAVARIAAKASAALSQ